MPETTEAMDQPKPALELHVFVTEVRGGAHEPLAQWRMHPDPERRPLKKENLPLAEALVQRLAKHLNREGGA